MPGTEDSDGERIRHVNRLKGLFFAQGIVGYEPRNKDRRERLEPLRTGDGRPLPKHLKTLALRELEVIELLNRQIEAVKAERDALLEEAPAAGSALEPARMLLELKGIGPGFAGALWSEGLFRKFANRRQVAAYAGLAPTPWKSGTINHEQGVSKAGNPRLRAIAVEWPGSGCGISRVRRLHAGITRESAGSAHAPGKSRSSLWRANCLSLCGST